MEKLKKMKFLLLLPIWGNIIIMIYLNFKLNKIPYIKRNHWLLVGLIIGIIFWVVIISVFALVSAIMKQYNIANKSIFISAFVVAFIVANYLSYIPCLVYINYLIKQGKKEKIDNEKDNEYEYIVQNQNKPK